MRILLHSAVEAPSAAAAIHVTDCRPISDSIRLNRAFSRGGRKRDSGNSSGHHGSDVLGTRSSERGLAGFSPLYLPSGGHTDLKQKKVNNDSFILYTA